MATYDSLATEQKNILQGFLNFVRAWCGEQARCNNHGDALDSYVGAVVQLYAGSGAVTVTTNNEFSSVVAPSP